MYVIGRYSSVALALSLAACACDNPPDPPKPVQLDTGVLFSDAEIIDTFQPDSFVDAAMNDAGFVSDSGPRPDAGQYVLETIVRLDGVPSPDTIVLQGGTQTLYKTDENGRAFVTMDWSLEGDKWILASHPKARIWGAYLPENSTPPIMIELESYTADNPLYEYSDPGEPQRSPSTAECGHCHKTINQSWFNSPHRRTASNPKLHDLFRGSVHSIENESDCIAAQGRWLRASLPGQSQSDFQCFFGESVLSDLNTNCAEPPCSSNVTELGDCADCHAPGINGQLGGRDLRDATGIAYNYGVHCDVCHRVDEVLLEEPPGTGGRLKFLRPSEKASLALGGGGYLPITFGPSHDVQNPRMGSVQRDHYRKATICAGCHQHEQEVLVPGQVIDRMRWPSGKLPIQTTYGEWEAGPLSPGAPCQACHMPPDPMVSNGGDLQLYPFAIIGLQGGYVRAPGTVRQHSWVGPRTPESNMLELAGAVFIEKSVSQNTVTATVTLKNVGCGHALPTGEPMRSVLLLVEAKCGTENLDATGGDVVPEFGGWVQRKANTEDWTRWTNPEVGDVVRVVRRTGAYYDYQGYGDFGNGRFTAAQKGMPKESYVGMATILEVHSSSVSFSDALPSGDLAYLVKPQAYAGHPGFGYARVTADEAGNTMVPHYRATDIVSDNRLMPQQSWSTHHRFETTCANPVIEARLIHRPYAYQLATTRSWSLDDAIMLEVRK